MAAVQSLVYPRTNIHGDGGIQDGLKDLLQETDRNNATAHFGIHSL
jgi:hypothetical protein